MIKQKFFQRPIVKCVISIVGATLVSTTVLGITTGVITTAVVIGHELGHYLATRWAGGSAIPPVFIGLGILTIGITRIKNVPEDKKAFVYLAGPCVGAGIALAIFGGAIFVGAYSIALIAYFNYLSEYLNAIIGPDAKKARKVRV